MHVIVMGAGLAGVTSTWYLLRDGHQVTLIDRQPQPGMETSFANGGQLSVSHPEPWANPGAPGQILRWLGREDAPMLFRPQPHLAQWLWGLAFLRECLPGRARRNTDAIARLAQQSLIELRQLRVETGLRYCASTRGILHLFFTADEYAKAPARAALLRGYGMRVEVCPPARCADIEPALTHSRAPIHGGLFAPDDESGDAHLFTQRLAALCQQAGATLKLSTHIRKLHTAQGQISGIDITHPDDTPDTLAADAYVLAAGSYSPQLAQQVGERLMIYPVKGYSVTLPAGAGAPTVSITDESRRIVISRLDDRLRIAGTAELAGFNTHIHPARAKTLVDRALEIFPNAGPTYAAQYWAGLRPAVPSNQPYIRRSKIPNLYLNTGHGTLGWTLACGAARQLAEQVRGDMNL